MADELKLVVSLDFANGLSPETNIKKKLVTSIDAANNAFASGMQIIGTSEEAVELLDIATPNYILARNLSANFIELGVPTGQYTVRLNQNDLALFRIDGSTLYAKADTDNATLEYIVFGTT